eukprot:gene1467-856_t
MEIEMRRDDEGRPNGSYESDEAGPLGGVNVRGRAASPAGVDPVVSRPLRPSFTVVLGRELRRQGLAPSQAVQEWVQRLLSHIAVRTTLTTPQRTKESGVQGVGTRDVDAVLPRTEVHFCFAALGCTDVVIRGFCEALLRSPSLLAGRHPAGGGLPPSSSASAAAPRQGGGEARREREMAAAELEYWRLCIAHNGLSDACVPQLVQLLQHGHRWHWPHKGIGLHRDQKGAEEEGDAQKYDTTRDGGAAARLRSDLLDGNDFSTASVAELMASVAPYLTRSKTNGDEGNEATATRRRRSSSSSSSGEGGRDPEGSGNHAPDHQQDLLRDEGAPGSAGGSAKASQDPCGDDPPADTRSPSPASSAAMPPLHAGGLDGSTAAAVRERWEKLMGTTTSASPSPVACCSCAVEPAVTRHHATEVLEPAATDTTTTPPALGLHPVPPTASAGADARLTRAGDSSGSSHSRYVVISKRPSNAAVRIPPPPQATSPSPSPSPDHPEDKESATAAPGGGNDEGEGTEGADIVGAYLSPWERGGVLDLSSRCVGVEQTEEGWLPTALAAASTATSGAPTRGSLAVPAASPSLRPGLIAVLDLSHNHLQDLPDGVLPETLIRLDLSHNKLVSLRGGAWMARCGMLAVLNLRYNQLGAPGGDPEQPNDAETTRSRDQRVVRTRLRRGPLDGAFDHTPHLSHLFLGHNQLRHLLGIRGPLLVLLHTLDLSFNRIEKLGALRVLSFCASLRRLLLRGNPLQVGAMPQRGSNSRAEASRSLSKSAADTEDGGGAVGLALRPLMRNLCPQLIHLDGADLRYSQGRCSAAASRSHPHPTGATAAVAAATAPPRDNEESEAYRVHVVGVNSGERPAYRRSSSAASGPHDAGGGAGGSPAAAGQGGGGYSEAGHCAARLQAVKTHTRETVRAADATRLRNLRDQLSSSSSTSLLRYSAGAAGRSEGRQEDDFFCTAFGVAGVEATGQRKTGLSDVMAAQLKREAAAFLEEVFMEDQEAASAPPPPKGSQSAAAAAAAAGPARGGTRSSSRTTTELPFDFMAAGSRDEHPPADPPCKADTMADRTGTRKPPRRPSLRFSGGPQVTRSGGAANGTASMPLSATALLRQKLAAAIRHDAPPPATSSAVHSKAPRSPSPAPPPPASLGPPTNSSSTPAGGPLHPAPHTTSEATVANWERGFLLEAFAAQEAVVSIVSLVERQQAAHWETTASVGAPHRGSGAPVPVQLLPEKDRRLLRRERHELMLSITAQFRRDGRSTMGKGEGPAELCRLLGPTLMPQDLLAFLQADADADADAGVLRRSTPPVVDPAAPSPSFSSLPVVEIDPLILWRSRLLRAVDLCEDTKRCLRCLLLALHRTIASPPSGTRRRAQQRGLPSSMATGRDNPTGPAPREDEARKAEAALSAMVGEAREVLDRGE